MLRFALLYFHSFFFFFFREAFTRRFFRQHESVVWHKIMIRVDGKRFAFFHGRESKPEWFSFGYTEINLPGNRTN